MLRLLVASTLAAACAAPAPSPAAPPTAALPAATVLAWDEFESIAFGGEAPLRRDGKTLTLGAGNPLSGARWRGAALPTDHYQLEFTATRVQGNDFFCGLTFPVGDAHCTLILGGWGGALVGLSCLDGADASENDTTTHVSFVNGRAYAVRVTVRAGHISVDIDGERKVHVPIAGRLVSLRADVAATAPLAVCSYATVARLTPINLRRLVP